MIDVEGSMAAMIRLDRGSMSLSVRCWLRRIVAPHKRVLLNARTTRMPERPSRVTRLSLSSFSCMTLNSGIPLEEISQMTAASSGMTATRSWTTGRPAPSP